MIRFLLCLLLLAPVHAEIRAWTDDRDRTVEASFVKLDGDTVILRLQDGREVPFPLIRLSPPDQEYIEKIGSRPPDASTPRESLNFTSPWPDRVTFGEDPEIDTVEETPAEKRFIYESANFRYLSDVRLSKTVVRGFALMFEATHLYCRTLPIGMNGGLKTDGKYLIKLFEEFDDYVKAGGPPTSAGVFIHSSDTSVIMVPLQSLGVRPVGSGYMLDRDKSSGTLPHEITHQLTPGRYFSTNGWFIEGIAEYVATTPYRAGSFNLRPVLKEVVEYATAYGSKEMGGRALGTKIHLPHLKEFMLQPYREFVGSNANLNYGFGLLLTTYFFHMDGTGDGARIKAYLNALHDGQKEEAALEKLLDGRTFIQLEQDVARAWSRRGIDLSFDPEG